MHRISDISRLLGVSDDTIRRWIGSGAVKARQDDRRVLRVDGASLAEHLRAQQREHTGLEDGSRFESARNHIQGIVTAIRSDPVMSQVDLVAGNSRIVSLVSTEAVDALGLEVGSIAVAQVKATNVSIELPVTS
ncbi:TOBE domain-containing protein [uncultured Propionibacterium sp.]|uniref:TOBE domain-containing protein n=1 Tax=uncultured Propionibacterium sp. TaxID=218066 RepID=UPI00293070F5|nr:TOBE domain-containing protein [uncultured Propionibacterium sp.]